MRISPNCTTEPAARSDDVLTRRCRTVFISAAFICTCPPRLLILPSSRRGKIRTSWCFSFTVIGWFEAASNKLWAPRAPIALHPRISAPHFCFLRESCLFASLAFFPLQSDLCGRALDRWRIDLWGGMTDSHLRAFNRRSYRFAKTGKKSSPKI